MPRSATQSLNLRSDVVLDEEALAWSAWFEDLPLADKDIWVAQLASLLSGMQAYPYPSGRAGNLGLESPRGNLLLLRTALSHALSLLRSLHHSAKNSPQTKTSGIFPHAKVHRVLYDLDQWLTDHLNLSNALISGSPTADPTLRAWCRTLRATLNQNETLERLCEILDLHHAARTSDLKGEGWTVFGESQTLDSAFDDVLYSMDRSILWFRSAASLCQTQIAPAICYLPIAAALFELRQALRLIATRQKVEPNVALKIRKDFIEHFENDMISSLQQGLPPTPTQPEQREIAKKAPLACARAVKSVEEFRSQILEKILGLKSESAQPGQMLARTLIADLWVFTHILRAFADIGYASKTQPSASPMRPETMQEFVSNVDRYQHLLVELDINNRAQFKNAIEEIKTSRRAPIPPSDETLSVVLRCGNFLANKLFELEQELPASVSYETKVEALARFCAGMPVHRSHSGTPVPASVLS